MILYHSGIVAVEEPQILVRRNGRDADFENGFFDEEATSKNLKTHTLADQYLFHTQKSLSLLKFLKAEEVK